MVVEKKSKFEKVLVKNERERTGIFRKLGKTAGAELSASIQPIQPILSYFRRGKR